MERIFHLIHRADPPKKDITKDRWDEVARFIHNSLFLSHSLRKDTTVRVTIVGEEIYTLEIEGKKVQGMHPDERSIFGFIRGVFQGMYTEGVKLYRGFRGEEGIILSEDGDKIPPSKCYFYIGGPYGFPFLPKGKKISLGDVTYTASQTVTIVHYLLDVGIWKAGCRQ